MKALSVLLVAGLVAILVTGAQSQAGDACAFGCAAVEEPVCGYLRGVHRTFSSGCSMDLVACTSRQPWRKVADCACVANPNQTAGYRPGRPGK